MHDAGRQARSRVEWYHPGEIVLVTRVPRERALDETQVTADVHAAACGYGSRHLDGGCLDGPQFYVRCARRSDVAGVFVPQAD